jgi:protein arginine kinase activator
MLCGICGKNTATVHLTEIINNQMTELHLCEECAQKKSIEMQQQFGLADLLAGLAEFGKPSQTKVIGRLKCPNCHMTYSEFSKIGRLGCSKCYISFRKYLTSLLKKIHGSNQHLGKSPLKAAKAVKKRADIQQLRRLLQHAIETEEFEEAAKIRDRIKELEKKEG